MSFRPIIVITAAMLMSGCASFEQNLEENLAFAAPPSGQYKKYSWERLKGVQGDGKLRRIGNESFIYHEIAMRFEKGDRLPKDLTCAVVYYIDADRSFALGALGEHYYGNPHSRIALKRLVKTGQWSGKFLQDMKSKKGAKKSFFKSAGTTIRTI